MTDKDRSARFCLTDRYATHAQDRCASEVTGSDCSAGCLLRSVSHPDMSGRIIQVEVHKLLSSCIVGHSGAFVLCFPILHQTPKFITGVKP